MCNQESKKLVIVSDMFATWWDCNGSMFVPCHCRCFYDPYSELHSVSFIHLKECGAKQVTRLW